MKAHYHSQIYSTHRPEPLPLGEAKILLKDPIRVKLDDSVYVHLHPTSRLNYGKLQTVEHNIPVRPIGRVVDDDLVRIMTYLTEVHRFQ